MDPALAIGSRKGRFGVGAWRGVLWGRGRGLGEAWLPSALEACRIVPAACLRVAKGKVGEGGASWREIAASRWSSCRWLGLRDDGR